jgi:hypothetical protein
MLLIRSDGAGHQYHVEQRARPAADPEVQGSIGAIRHVTVRPGFEITQNRAVSCVTLHNVRYNILARLVVKTCSSL